MNRTVLFGTLLLLLSAVPALPGALAYEPCVKTTCVIVDDELPWACVGVNHQWEVYGACADAASACVGTRSGRLWQEHCLLEPAAAPAAGDVVRVQDGGVCVALAPEHGGTMTCAYPKSACASHHGGVVREAVCARDVLALLP